LYEKLIPTKSIIMYIVFYL